MTDEAPEKQYNYKSRKMLAEENDSLKESLAALMARIDALETSKSPAISVDSLVAALKEDREQTLSARLQRELDETRAQLDDLKRPATPTGGVPYRGWAQAKEDLWDGRQLRFGPNSAQARRPGVGDVFEIDIPDYWPGCPFTPVLVKGSDANGFPIVVPHPDFASH